MSAEHGWKQPGQRRQDRPVSPIQPGPAHLTPEHRNLVTEHHDLRIFGRQACARVPGCSRASKPGAGPAGPAPGWGC